MKNALSAMIGLFAMFCMAVSVSASTPKDTLPTSLDGPAVCQIDTLSFDNAASLPVVNATVSLPSAGLQFAFLTGDDYHAPANYDIPTTRICLSEGRKRDDIFTSPYLAISHHREHRINRGDDSPAAFT
jgi:hypothetical protein